MGEFPSINPNKVAEGRRLGSHNVNTYAFEPDGRAFVHIAGPMPTIADAIKVAVALNERNNRMRLQTAVKVGVEGEGKETYHNGERVPVNSVWVEVPGNELNTEYTFVSTNNRGFRFGEK